MANRIKGITVEIGGDTTKLSKALEGVNKDIKGTQTQLKDVQKLLKLDPTNTELLSQKHKLLADAVSATKEKLEVLKTAAEQANTALANGEISQQQYDALQREIIETENELKRLTTEANNSHTALEKMGVLGETLQSAGDKISGVGQKLLPVTAGVTALGTIAVKTGADFDSAMSKVAAVSGATGCGCYELHGDGRLENQRYAQRCRRHHESCRRQWRRFGIYFGHCHRRFDRFRFVCLGQRTLCRYSGCRIKQCQYQRQHDGRNFQVCRSGAGFSGILC